MVIPDEMLSVQDVARQLRVKEGTVRLWIRTGKLHAHRASPRPSGRLWIDPQDLAAVVNGGKQESEHTAEPLTDYRPGDDELGIGLLSSFALSDEEREGR